MVTVELIAPPTIALTVAVIDPPPALMVTVGDAAVPAPVPAK